MSAFSKTHYNPDSNGVAVIDDRSSSGNHLGWNFFGLGMLTGKTIGEIIAGVGMPTSRCSMARGQTLLEWHATGYRIALLFNAQERVVKITAESTPVACRRRA